MEHVGGVRSKDSLRERLFLGELLKGGISIKQVPAGTRRSEISTATLRGCGERFIKDCFVLVGSVWHTVGSWNNNDHHVNGDGG